MNNTSRNREEEEKIVRERLSWGTICDIGCIISDKDLHKAFFSQDKDLLNYKCNSNNCEIPILTHEKRIIIVFELGLLDWAIELFNPHKNKNLHSKLLEGAKINESGDLQFPYWMYDKPSYLKGEPDWEKACEEERFYNLPQLIGSPQDSISFLEFLLNEASKSINFDKSLLKKNIRKLFFDSSFKIKNLTYFTNLPNLEEFWIENASGFNISILKSENNLKNLFLGKRVSDDDYYPSDHIGSLSDISAIKTLMNLESLELRRCDEVNLSEIKYLKNLKHLVLRELGFEWDISSFRTLENLQTLRLSDCPNLSDISVVGKLKNLKEISLSGCHLQDISDLGNLENLKYFKISDCSELNDISAISTLKNLESLEIDRCPSLTDISAIGELENVTKLVLSDFTSLIKIPNLCGLKSLKTLEIWDFPGISNISGIGMAKNLSELSLNSCDKLNDISAISTLESLKNLAITCCRNISNEDFLPITKLCDKNLSTVDLTGCYQLRHDDLLFKKLRDTEVEVSYLEWLEPSY